LCSSFGKAMNSFQLKYKRFLQLSHFLSASFQHCLSYNLGKHKVHFSAFTFSVSELRTLSLSLSTQTDNTRYTKDFYLKGNLLFGESAELKQGESKKITNK